MRFDMQVKLLRVLEEAVITRVGGNGTISVNVRIISATHQDLTQAITDGRFREDLYFRLGVLPVAIAPLHQRREDIPALLRHFQAKSTRRCELQVDITGMRVLQDHGWPGNVRELRNVFERAMALFPGESIDARKAEQLLGRAPAAKPVACSPAPAAQQDDGSPIDLRQLLESTELNRIRAALEQADGVISEAARLLTLKRTTLIEKMRRYGVAGG
jgi:sigma-54 dependent transcriptional regulator, flagellar regulatory protein